MIKDLLQAIDYSICAEIALGLFFVAFVGILFSCLRLSRSASDRFASIPINDQQEPTQHG